MKHNHLLRRSSPVLRVIVAVVALLLVASACGDSENITSVGGDSDTNPPQTGPSETTPPETTGSIPADEAQFIGLNEDEAGALADGQSRRWRVGRVDGEIFALTDDYIIGRVTFEIDNGLVTTAGIERDLSETAGPPTTVVGATPAELVSGAIVRMITEDNGFSEGSPFGTVYIATLITADFSDVDPAALDQAAAALRGRMSIEFIADAEGKITDLFSAEGTETSQPMQVAVVSVDDVRIDGDKAEVDMGLWCGSLCGVWLTYAAELVDGAWMITGTTGPIAVS
jgi:hypothetical protein